MFRVRQDIIPVSEMRAGELFVDAPKLVYVFEFLILDRVGSNSHWRFAGIEAQDF